MAADPYTTLGVKKHATQEEIQKAYRRLAKKLHPDLNPGNKISEDKFKEVSAAYDLLGDPKKRARFDRGESTPQAPSGRGSSTTGISPIRTAGQPTPATQGFPILAISPAAKIFSRRFSAVPAVQAAAGGARTSTIISSFLS